jgi:hypothetical protein
MPRTLDDDGAEFLVACGFRESSGAMHSLSAQIDCLASYSPAPLQNGRSQRTFQRQRWNAKLPLICTASLVEVAHLDDWFGAARPSTTLPNARAALRQAQRERSVGPS